MGHAATMNDFLIQEITYPYFERFDQFAEHHWSIKDAYVNVPDLPGLGVTIKEFDIASIPYDSMPYRQIRHADGAGRVGEGVGRRLNAHVCSGPLVPEGRPFGVVGRRCR